MSKDVCIIGAGVAGLVLAKELSKMGIGATVYDSKSDVRENADKASGVLSKSGMDKTGINYSRAIVNALNGAVINSQSESITIKSKSTKAFVVDRKILAQICLEEATAEGAKVNLGKRLTKPQIIKKAKEFKVLVGADGAVSSTASAFDFPRIKEYVLTYKAEYRNAAIDDSNSVGMYFDNSVTKSFFGWSIPYSPTVIELGIGTSSSGKKNSKSAFTQFIKNPKIKAIIKNAEFVSAYASLIPLSQRKTTVIKNVLLVGDAAGQVKATTGGGIIFGTASAKVAAESIKKYISEGKSLDSYDAKWRKQYGLDLSMHKFFHASYSSIGTKQMDMLLKMMKLFGAASILSNYGDMDKPTEMLKNVLLHKKV